MKRKYLSFDIETSRVLPENEHNLKAFRPLGIACAATLLSDTDELALWAGKEQMSQQDAGELVHYLQIKVGQGYSILGWNGLSFDFDILAEESGMLEVRSWR